MCPDFEQLPHTADMKIRVYGTTMKKLFRNALVGMFTTARPLAPGCSFKDEQLICPSLPTRRTIAVRAIDRDALLVDFLSEALYLSDIHNEAYLDAIIHELDNQHIHAILHGVSITGFEVVEIKAVTHHDLKIIEKDGMWQVDIVFDI